MRKQRGFVYYDERRQRFGIDWRETLSVAIGELLLQEILLARSFIKGRLLDVGCGVRPYALIYEPLVETSVGTEVAYSPHGTGAADAICPAERLPFANQSFDTILCTEVLEHTSEPFVVMEEFARLLKPGGHLLLSVPFIYPIHEAPYDHWRFTSYGIARLCKLVGLEVVYVHPKGKIGATLTVLWCNLAVRGVNAISKLLHQPTPLRDRMVIRWLLVLPQWAYLWLQNTRIAKSTAIKNIYAELGDFLTPGYFLVARR
ncbi:MAG: class I SAM-dependent methyltransferase [Dehalococcoidia bacterium]|nr:class I SAM-dependent methyltransferase [Dehalococcoidia bacterium]